MESKERIDGDGVVEGESTDCDVGMERIENIDFDGVVEGEKENFLTARWRDLTVSVVRA